MPPGFAARITDATAHPIPGTLFPGPGCITVLIGFMLAWRGVPLEAVAGLQAAKASADAAITAAKAATVAAAGTPGAPAALAAEQATTATALASMSGLISSLGTDIHACLTPLPVLPHGPGVVITASATVKIGFLPAARAGDTILEAIGPPNIIAKGETKVIIGG